MRRKDLKADRTHPRRKLSREEAHAYIRKYRLINEIEERELKDLSLAERLRQIAAAMRLGASLGFTSPSDRDVEFVRERWAKLRRAAS